MHHRHRQPLDGNFLLLSHNAPGEIEPVGRPHVNLPATTHSANRSCALISSSRPVPVAARPLASPRLPRRSSNFQTKRMCMAIARRFPTQRRRCRRRRCRWPKVPTFAGSTLNLSLAVYPPWLGPWDGCQLTQAKGPSLPVISLRISGCRMELLSRHQPSVGLSPGH